MPRINIDDELRGDPRFTALCTKIPRHEAFGALVCLWEVGQSYWKKGEQLIPKAIFDLLPHSSELVRHSFGVCSENGVYCVGARERWGFLLARSEAGKRSAMARNQKYGSPIPINGSNNRTNAEQKPNKTEHSSSSSSSSSLFNTNTPQAEPADFVFESFWKEFQERNGTRGSKKKAIAQWIKLTQKDKEKAVNASNVQKKHYEACKASNLFVPEFPDCWRWLRDRRFEDEITKKKTWQEIFQEEIKKEEESDISGISNGF